MGGAAAVEEQLLLEAASVGITKKPYPSSDRNNVRLYFCPYSVTQFKINANIILININDTMISSRYIYILSLFRGSVPFFFSSV